MDDEEMLDPIALAIVTAGLKLEAALPREGGRKASVMVIAQVGDGSPCAWTNAPAQRLFQQTLVEVERCHKLRR